MVVLIPLNVGSVDTSLSLAKEINKELSNRNIESYVKPPVNVHKLEGFKVLIGDTFDIGSQYLQIDNKLSVDESILKIVTTWSKHVNNHTFQS